MPPLSHPRSRLVFGARRRSDELSRATGAELRRSREDAGISQRRLAVAASISQGYLNAVEAGSAHASAEALERIASALGGRLAVRLEPNTGPLLRDHLQAAMSQALIRGLHPRWHRMLEVAVYRPVRGVIDVVLHDPDEPIVVAVEVHSALRRLEQQIRWARSKAEALDAGGVSELTRTTLPLGRAQVSQVLALRSTRVTRELASTYSDLLDAAYPARHEDAVAALRGTQPWPGSAIVWMRVEGSTAVMLERPPRAVRANRVGDPAVDNGALAARRWVDPSTAPCRQFTVPCRPSARPSHGARRRDPRRQAV
jgi:transcriptional regulator with XRE-family HTH domain